MSGYEALPVFMPPSAADTDENMHVLFCKLYTYDAFQNKKCLFKGLARVWVSPNDVERDEDDDGDRFYPFRAHSPTDRPAPCVRQLNSYYGKQLKKRFTAEMNDVDAVAMCSETTENDWSLNSQSDGNMFQDNLEVDGYIGLVDAVDPSFQSLDNYETPEMPNKITSNKLDYEMLLPPSAVESSSYLTLQPPQTLQEQSGDYERLYDGLFDNFHDDQASIVNEELVDRKDSIGRYVYENDMDTYENDASSNESYLLPETSRFSYDSTPRRRSVSSSKNSDATCNLCGRKCRTLNALNHHMLVHSEDRPYVCEICKKAFKEQPTLRRHMWTHMEKQHQCDICEKYFVEKSSLRRHISTIHADFKPGGSKAIQCNSKQQYSCGKCGKMFKSHAKFTMHRGLHGNPNYECDVCGKVYAGRSHLRIHQRIHTGEKPYTCNMCNMQFAFKHVLKSHQARIHQKVHKFKCNLCSLTFVKKSDLSAHAGCHMVNMKKGKRHCNTAAMVARRRTTKKADVKSEYAQNCVMKYNFVSPSYAVNGLFGQLIDLAPDCHEQYNDVDVESFNSKDESCKSPRSSINDQGKKNKECLECFKAFERTGDLKRHIISHIVDNSVKKARERNDSSIPQYECEICEDTVFKQVDKFKKHLREHAKLTLYQCDICDRAFGDSSNFSKHKKVHGVAYLKCTICGRKFNTKRMMVRHMEYHRHNKPKSCPHCRKLFHFESNLRKHVKIVHTTKGKMTFRCEECGERFGSVKTKWEHQWEAHGIRKVDADCYMCGAQFRKVSLLRAHLVREHATALPINNGDKCC